MPVGLGLIPDAPAGSKGFIHRTAPGQMGGHKARDGKDGVRVLGNRAGAEQVVKRKASVSRMKETARLFGVGVETQVIGIVAGPPVAPSDEVRQWFQVGVDGQDSVHLAGQRDGLHRRVGLRCQAAKDLARDFQDLPRTLLVMPGRQPACVCLMAT